MLAQPDGGEDQAHLASGNHAHAHEQPVARRAPHAGRGGELPGHSDDEHRAGEPQHRRFGELAHLCVDPDLQEEHGDEEVADRCQLPPNALRRRAAGEREAGDEGTDDRCELGRAGQLGHAQREREGKGDERSARPAVAGDGSEQAGGETHADHGRDGEKGDRHRHDRQHRDHRHRALGDESYDHREHDQAHHVVGDRGSDHCAGLDHGQRTQVAEHARRYADARGRERGADEQRLLAIVGEQPRDARPGREQRDHADGRHGQRRPAHCAELGEVHLEPDLEEQQDHAELAQHAHDVVSLDETQHGRPDEDPGDDLADDGRHLDPFGDLGRHLGREQKDENVQKDRVHVHGRARPTLRR